MLIDQELLARLTAPDYGPALNGFSKHLEPPRKEFVRFDGGTRPRINWDAWDRFDGKTRICRIKGCGKPTLGGSWRHCSDEHSALFLREVRYYEWTYTRYDVLERDNFSCLLCGVNLRMETREYGYAHYEYKPYQCDHIIPWAYVVAKFADMSVLEKIHRFYLNRENLRTLCHTCHSKVTIAFVHFWSANKRGVSLSKDGTSLTSFL